MSGLTSLDFSVQSLQNTQNNLSSKLDQLSSGNKYDGSNSSKGINVSSTLMSHQISRRKAVNNTMQGMSVLETAEGGYSEIYNNLVRLKELAVQSANGTYSGADRVALNAEIVELKNELLRISETTKFNDVKLLNGSFTDTTFEIGYDESPGHAHNLSIESVKPDDLGMWTTHTQQEKTITVGSVANYGSSPLITASADHGFVDGDQVTYEAQSGVAKISGLVSGQTYLVTNTTGTTQFALTDLDGNAVSYGKASANTDHGTGVGAKFHLASLAGAPTVGEAGTTAPTSEVLKTEDLTIHGYVGSTTVQVATASTAKAMAEAISATESLTGVKATAQTNARLTVTPDNNTNDYRVISFELSGMNTTSKLISASITMGTGDGNFSADLSDLRDKINGFSGATGIQASLSSDKSYIDLKSPDGYDIIIENVDFPTKIAGDRVTATSTASNVNTNNTITTQAAHGFAVGDQVRINSLPAHGETMDGITTGVTYTVATTPTTDTFTLTTSDGTAVNITTDNDGTVTFEKVEPSLNFQATDRNKNLKGVAVELVDKELVGENAPNAVDSARITGDVQYESSQVFTLVPAIKDSLFRDAPPAATLLKVSEMNILTVDNSHKMLTSIDGALKRVDAERGDLGATMNRMGHTIDNLGNISVNLSASRSRIEDADMALETAELAKTQILQQAATAMVGQANKAMQTILTLLR